METGSVSAASGAWTAGSARELDGLARKAAVSRPATRSGTIDARGIESFDTFGALILDRLVRECERRAAACGS